MAGVNRVILIGNLGKDPEIRTLENGVKVANFTIATTETFKTKNGEKSEHTEWHNIVMWRGLAEIAEKFLRKGKTIYIEGKLQTRSWDDSQGNKRYTTEIVVDNMTMLGGPRDQSAEHVPNGKTAPPPPPEPTIPEDGTQDDLPF